MRVPLCSEKTADVAPHVGAEQHVTVDSRMWSKVQKRPSSKATDGVGDVYSSRLRNCKCAASVSPVLRVPVQCDGEPELASKCLSKSSAGVNQQSVVVSSDGSKTLNIPGSTSTKEARSKPSCPHQRKSQESIDAGSKYDNIGNCRGPCNNCSGAHHIHLCMKPCLRCADGHVPRECKCSRRKKRFNGMPTPVPSSDIRILVAATSGDDPYVE